MRHHYQHTWKKLEAQLPGYWAVELNRNLHWWYRLLPGVVLVLWQHMRIRMRVGVGRDGGRQILLTMW